MFGAIAGGIASALAGGAMSKLFGGGQKAASGGIQGDVLATDNNTVGMGDAGIKSAIQGSNVPNPDEAVPSFVSGAMAKAGKGLLEGTLQAGTSAVSDKLLDLVGLGGKSAADKGKDTRDYLAAAFPELNAWERAGADASSAGMVDAGFENQKELTKMQLDNQKEIAEMQNETQKEIAGIQSATSRQNTKDQVYAQNEMLAYQQKESTARVASIMENTNLSKQQQVSEIMRQMLTQAQDRKSGSAGMPRPRSTLFPYTTLFRSSTEGVYCSRCVYYGKHQSLQATAGFRDYAPNAYSSSRSEERFSRNAETEIYTLSLHDALPIFNRRSLLLALRLLWKTPISPSNSRFPRLCAKCLLKLKIGRAVQQECRDRDLHSFPTRRSSDLQQKESTARVASIMENTNLSKQQQVSEIMRQMLTQAQTAGQYFTNDQIKEMTRKVSAEVDLVHQQTQNQRYSSSHIGATAKDISNVVTDAASGVVDIFHGIDKAVADTWNNFWKDGKADGIGSNLSRK